MSGPFVQVQSNGRCYILFWLIALTVMSIMMALTYPMKNHNGSGGSVLSGFTNAFFPLYFELRQVKEVMATEQPCDWAYDFGNGLLGLQEYPRGFPKPGEITLLCLYSKTLQ